MLDCPQNTSCAAQTCCGPKKETPKLNIHNGAYKGYTEVTPTSVRRRPRNDQGPDCDLLQIPLSEVNVEVADADADNSDEDDVGPDVKLSALRAKLDNNVV